MMSRLCLTLLLVMIVAIELHSTSPLAAQTDSREQAKFTPAEEASVLVEALANSDKRVRDAAAERLLEMGTVALPELRQALKNSDPHVYQPAAEILGNIGEQGLPVLIEGLTSKNVLARVKAADALRGMGKNAIPGLCDVLRHGTWTGRSDGGDGVCQIAQETIVERRFSSQPDARVQHDFEQADLRREAADVLGAIGEDLNDAATTTQNNDAAAAADIVKEAAPAIPVLVDTLNDHHEPVRGAAGNALQSIGESAIPALLEVLQGDNAQARYTATQVLGVFGRELATLAPALGEATKDEDLLVRTAAAEALCEAYVPLVRTEASKALDGVYSDAVIALIDAEAQVILKESAVTVPMLREPITDPHRRVRFLAVVAANKFGGVAAGAERRATVASVDDIVDKAAKEAGDAADKIRIREDVKKAFDEAVESNRHVREAAEQALRIAAEDRDLVVRVAAAMALRKLAP